mmetsp:Transcript_81337/g.218736  ORF Transcript_81337/g.218736 Transcript_81337/m.218736 type:complete len:312 (-) Transcript_81337:804-1739(-)
MTHLSRLAAIPGPPMIQNPLRKPRPISRVKMKENLWMVCPKPQMGHGFLLLPSPMKETPFLVIGRASEHSEKDSTTKGTRFLGGSGMMNRDHTPKTIIKRTHRCGIIGAHLVEMNMAVVYHRVQRHITFMRIDRVQIDLQIGLSIFDKITRLVPFHENLKDRLGQLHRILLAGGSVHIGHYQCPNRGSQRGLYKNRIQRTQSQDQWIPANSMLAGTGLHRSMKIPGHGERTTLEMALGSEILHVRTPTQLCKAPHLLARRCIHLLEALRLLLIVNLTWTVEIVRLRVPMAFGIQMKTREERLLSQLPRSHR